MKEKIKTRTGRTGMKNRIIAPIVAAVGMALLPMTAKAQEYTNAVVNNITNDMKLTWNWIDMYQLDRSAAEGGTVTGTTNGWYDSGTTISNNAVADSHRVFLNWAGVPAGMESNNPVVFSLNQPYTNIVANFDWETHFLDVDSEYGSATGEGDYKYGSSATSTVERVIDDVAPGVRRRVTGYTLENL